MTESDVDTQIKTYWAVREHEFSQDFLEELENIFKEFHDVTRDTPGSACEFLSYLDLECANKFLRSLYKRDPDYPATAMVKALLLKDLLKFKFNTELERYLIVNQDYASMLGFPPENGIVPIPSSKTFWHFDRIRMAIHWDDFFYLLRNECVFEGKKLGLPIGRKVTEDSTPIEGLKKDNETKYNDYYEESGYKLDTLVDLDHGLILSKQVIGINEDEAKCVVPHLEETMAAGIDTRDIWVDGGYDDYPNLAWCGVHDIQVHHRIHKNWVHNPKGDEEAIMKLYQKHWKDEDFRPNAGISYILPFLYDRGEIEAVGAYFRNNAMAREQADPEGYLNDYHLRNRQEGHHGYWKEYMDVEQRLRVKGRFKVDQYLTRNLCTLLGVALCRLQHGVKTNLTSVAYFT